MNRKHCSVVVYKFTSINCPNNHVKLSGKTTNYKGLISCLLRRLFPEFEDKIVIVPWPPSSSDQLPHTHGDLLFYLIHRQVSCQIF